MWQVNLLVSPARQSTQSVPQTTILIAVQINSLSIAKTVVLFTGEGVRK